MYLYIIVICGMENANWKKIDSIQNKKKINSEQSHVSCLRCNTSGILYESVPCNNERHDRKFRDVSR